MRALNEHKLNIEGNGDGGEVVNEGRVTFKGKDASDLLKSSKGKDIMVFVNNNLYSITQDLLSEEPRASKSIYGLDSDGEEKEIVIRNIEFIEMNESVNEATKIAFLNDKLIREKITKSGLLPLLGANNASLSTEKSKFIDELTKNLLSLYKDYSSLPIK